MILTGSLARTPLQNHFYQYYTHNIHTVSFIYRFNSLLIFHGGNIDVIDSKQTIVHSKTQYKRMLKFEISLLVNEKNLASAIVLCAGWQSHTTTHVVFRPFVIWNFQVTKNAFKFTWICTLASRTPNCLWQHSWQRWWIYWRPHQNQASPLHFSVKVKDTQVSTKE